jgi:hypothetical protein
VPCRIANNKVIRSNRTSSTSGAYSRSHSAHRSLLRSSRSLKESLNVQTESTRRMLRRLERLTRLRIMTVPTTTVNLLNRPLQSRTFSRWMWRRHDSPSRSTTSKHVSRTSMSYNGTFAVVPSGGLSYPRTTRARCYGERNSLLTSTSTSSAMRPNSAF